MARSKTRTNSEPKICLARPLGPPGLIKKQLIPVIYHRQIWHNTDTIHKSKYNISMRVNKNWFHSLSGQIKRHRAFKYLWKSVINDTLHIINAKNKFRILVNWSKILTEFWACWNKVQKSDFCLFVSYWIL